MANYFEISRLILSVLPNVAFTRRAANKESHHKNDEGRLKIKVQKSADVARSECKALLGEAAPRKQLTFDIFQH
jgi:hypothetical protein